MKKRLSLPVWLILGLVMMLVLAACGPAEATPEASTTTEDTTTESTNTEGATTSEKTDTEATAPEDLNAANPFPTPEAVAEEDYVITDTGLKYYDLVEGEGDSPQEGDIVFVNYTIWLADADNQFVDSSDFTGRPIQFILGANQIFPGWDEAVATMHLGGKRQVVVPPELGFGEAGAGTVIPPNATLLLELELDSFRTPPKPEDIAEADYTTTDSGLQYYNLEEGDGETPEAGDLVSVEYVIWLQDGLTYVGSSEDQGQPFEFALGSGRVFPGWDEAVSTMRVGDKRQLVIPPELGLGEQGGGSVIPPNATLIMQVELVDIRKPAQIMELDDDQYEVTEGGVKYYDIKPGDGPAAESGMTLEVHYTGWLEDGTKFDSSLDAGRTFQFVLGAGMVIPGWDEGLVGMKVGGVRQLVIPSELAYGSTGAGGVIPPDATLIFQVELVSIGQ